jgi:hypothetical protein
MKTNYYSQFMQIDTALKSSIDIFKTAYIKTGAIAFLFFIMMSGQKIQAQYSYDFGDAPDSYHTLLANNGSHVGISQSLHIGATVDTEADGQPSVNADGDVADDDGLAVIPPLNTTTTTYSLDVQVFDNTFSDHTLWGWIDFNRNGTFDCNEYAEAFVGGGNPNLQTVTLTWSGLTGLVAGQSYIRLIIEQNDDGENQPPSCSCASGSRSFSYGEVEDYTVTIQHLYDFGDAPDSYNTLMANNGAHTELNPDLHIGATVDGEVDGQPSVNADEDGADEDGLAVIPPLASDATTYSLDVSVYNNNPYNQTWPLWGWIDFNRDGTFDCNEYAEVNVPPGTGLQTVTLTWSGITGLVTGQSYIRLRIEQYDDFATDCSNAFTGTRAFGSGEIEDYTVTITCGQISAPTITTVTQPLCSVITGGGSVVLGNLPSSGTWTLTREPGTVITTGTSTSTTISGLAQGTYTFMVTNSFGCDSSVSANVVITDPTCNSGIFPTSVTCSSYKTGANSLSQLCYTSKSNKVSNVTPGQFFYYTVITAPSTSFTVDVIETKSCSGLALFGINQKNQILLWNPNCKKVAQGTQVSLGDGRIRITNATVGTQYILSVKYDSKTIIGSTFTRPASTCTYRFVSKIAGVTVSGSVASIDLVPNCKTTSTDCKTTSTGKVASTTAKTAADVTPTADNTMDVEVFPVPFKDELFLRYKFETDSNVSIEIFDIEGRLLARESDTKVFFDKELKIKNNFKTLSNKVYFIKISSDKGSVTKTVISK